MKPYWFFIFFNWGQTITTSSHWVTPSAPYKGNGAAPSLPLSSPSGTSGCLRRDESQSIPPLGPESSAENSPLDWVLTKDQPQPRRAPIERRSASLTVILLLSTFSQFFWFFSVYFQEGASLKSLFSLVSIPSSGRPVALVFPFRICRKDFRKVRHRHRSSEEGW